MDFNNQNIFKNVFALTDMQNEVKLSQKFQRPSNSFIFLIHFFLQSVKSFLIARMRTISNN